MSEIMTAMTDDARQVLEAARALPPAAQLQVLQGLAQSIASALTPQVAPESKLAELQRMSERFWHGPSIEELAREQGVKPITSLEDLDALASQAWPEEESVDDFLNSIYEMRRESGDK